MNTREWQQKHQGIDFNDPHNFSIAWDSAVKEGREACKVRAIEIIEWHRNEYNAAQIDAVVADVVSAL